MLCFHKFHSDDGMTGFRLGLLHGGTSEFDPIRIEDVTGMMQELPDFGECLLENFAVIAYDGVISINGIVNHWNCPALFKSMFLVSVLNIDIDDAKNLAHILSATGGRYFMFPTHFGTLLIKDTGTFRGEVVPAEVMNTDNPGVYTAWFDM